MPDVPLTKKQDKDILSFALQNAVFHSGKADAGAVLGKMLGSHPKLKKNIGHLREKIQQAVNEVNKLPAEEQKKQLERLGPSLLKKEVKQKEELPEIPGARKGRIVTRFAPAPTGGLHIFHLLRPAFLNYLYAKKYNGKFILRIEDTDPEKVKKEAYDWIMQDLEAVGIVPDRVVKQSENMGDYYKYAKMLLKEGKAYICICSQEEFKKIKLSMIGCTCRNNIKEENIEKFERMLSGRYRAGESVARLKANMQDPNPVLRDPPLLRISDAEHPLAGKYRVWPLYNFSCTVDDHMLGITHVFRAKEHEHNTAVQERIFHALGWKPPVTVNFGMLRLPGGKLHKRDIRKMLASGEITGWDDPKLPTVRAFLRRGFLPETFRQMALMCGLSKTDIVIGWENLEGINRKLLDPIANRYMVVLNPEKISVAGIGNTAAELSLHPDYPERGKRKMPVDRENIYISKGDFEAAGSSEFRLMGLGNVRLDGGSGVYTGDKIVREMQKVQWVSEPNVKVDIIKPGETISGLGEPSIQKLKPGDIIQMERVGFGRVDAVLKDKIVICWAHK